VSTTKAEIIAGERFAFGENWHDFVDLVDEPRIRAAVDSLSGPLGVRDLSERTFLDIGCGSGLFSLAAVRLGARVHSFDFDEMSVAAAEQLRRRYAPEGAWAIEQGSVLDDEYMNALGRFDVVYAWGVLHHTGAMWKAIDAASRRVAPGGLLFLSIYNAQGRQSRMWLRVKRRYNRSGRVMRSLLIITSLAYLSRERLLSAASRVTARRSTPAKVRAARTRGMSARHDLVDWVGGYPFEVAKPEEVFARAREAGFELRYLKTCAGGIGCNEYVFQLVSDAWAH
jgi:2-polyprenyl-6-hydroxyphenyl methylase/3-demethylubiquinone-9 3-methyltransferase